MKKSLLCFAVVLFCTTVFSQSFSDDFESYNVGDLIAASSSDWTTWTNSPGSAEDAPISDLQASSGTQSLYFSSNAAGGGPQDVILPFGDHYTDGEMVVSMMILVEEGKGGYFNFQGLPTVGQDWSMNVFFNQNGELTIDNATQVVGTGTFTNGEWWNLTFNIDLTSNSWEAVVDGTSLGTFNASSNQIASIDFFPYNATGNGGNNISGYFIDDISFDYTPYTPLALDAALFTVNVAPLGLTGQEKNVNGSIINLGTNAITSFDIDWSYGSESGMENYSGLNIANLDEYEFAFSAPITLIEGTNSLDIEIVNVNGSVDQNQGNNDGITNIEAVTPAPGKVVVGEEATGTWCGWCPRGAVFMEYMHDNYEGYFAGIAVHNADPMEVTEYDDGFGASSFPNLQVDRSGWIDPSEVELNFISSIQEEVDATVDMAGYYSNGQFDVTATVNALADLNNYSIAVAIIENNVTGTGSGWPQVNYYSGGATVMGGYENLPDPVPAADMVYQEVARAILGGVGGSDLSDLTNGNSESQSFTYMVPADQNINEMLAIGMLIAPNGTIHNAGILEFEEIVGLEEEIAQDIDLSLFPNPANEQSNISLNLETSSHVSIAVVDAVGKTVFARDYGTISGQMFFPINTQELSNGSYIVLTEVDGVVISKKLMIHR